MGKLPILDEVGTIDRPIDDKDYERQLEKLQHRLLDLQVWHLRTGGRVVIGIDGWDAAGKGGLIERIVEGLEPKSTQVWRIGAPTPDEQGRHYLWRFWQRLPAPGNWAIFDRSWYGRVLVERVEGLCDRRAWQRAYREINEFERALTDDGVRLVKLFLHITPEAQLERFRERLSVPYKRWKLTPEDLRNRRHWAEYATAIDEMFVKTSTVFAPWHAVPSVFKWYGRVKALELIRDTLGAEVDVTPPPADPETEAMIAAMIEAGGGGPRS